MGRILFLSAISYLAYRYITRSNKKAQKELALRHAATLPEPESHAELIDAASAGRLIESRSAAAEPDPRR